MIELSFSIWHVWGLVYAASCFSLLLLTVITMVDDGESFKEWAKLTLVFVWPLFVPMVLFAAFNGSAREIKGRLRAEGQYREFQKWRELQREITP